MTSTILAKLPANLDACQRTYIPVSKHTLVPSLKARIFNSKQPQPKYTFLVMPNCFKLYQTFHDHTTLVSQKVVVGRRPPAVLSCDINAPQNNEFCRKKGLPFQRIPNESLNHFISGNIGLWNLIFLKKYQFLKTFQSQKFRKNRVYI